MRRPSGVVLVLAGLSVAAYALTGSETPPDAAPSGLEANEVFTVAESHPDSSPRPGTSSAATAEVRPLADSIGKAALPAASSRITRNKETARAVVLAGGAVRTPVGQPMAGNRPPLDRAALTRDLQRQLQRVGCYRGSISGVWSPSTRQAMKDFIDHVNATLPVSEPDPILLAMLQSHEEKACGQGCRIGESLGGNGQRLPSVIIAREPARQRPEARALTAHQAPAPRDVHGNGPATAVTESAAGPQQPMTQQQSMPGRMALAGPEAGNAPSTADTHAVGPKADPGKEASRSRTRKAGSPKYVPNSRKRMGAWIFHDAPVDRLLAR
jgi:peptidoglycan hydrolase-like protein with peptidoglycan-binding domain